MIWFYERAGRYVRCETRDVPQTAGVYELVTTDHADGIERVERFESSQALFKRQEELELTLLYDGWSGPFGRVM